MHFPSVKVHKQMLSEPSFVWFVPSEGDDTHAVLVKAHSSILRSIISGAKVQLLCAVNDYKGEKYLCLELRIHDDANYPLSIFKIQREEEEHGAFWKILKRKVTPVFFFDELCQCVAWAEIRFGEKGVSEITRLIGNPGSLYAGEFNEDTLFSMDCMDYTIDPSRQHRKAKELQKVDLEVELAQFDSRDIFNFGIGENHKFRIETVEGEGEGFEQRIWTALESIFPFGIYKSPQVTKGGKERELIDILCLAGDNMLLLEAKTLSFFKGNSEKSMEQKVNRLQKHIDKALDQLQGAIKQIRKKSRIYRKKPEKSDDIQDIKFTDNQILIPHALVIVSELLPYGDWTGYFEKCSQLSKNNHARACLIRVKPLPFWRML